VIDDPEDEAWAELERRQAERNVPQAYKPVRVKSFEDAFNDYLDNPGAPRSASDSEVRRHFQAGWVAGIRNEWAKERND
jgi:hypothetical protein